MRKFLFNHLSLDCKYHQPKGVGVTRSPMATPSEAKSEAHQVSLDLNIADKAWPAERGTFIGYWVLCTYLH